MALDKLDNNLNERLLGVYHQINCDNFYQMKDSSHGLRENSRELRKRLDKQTSQHILDIDSEYNEMAEQEKLAVKQRKRTETIKLNKNQTQQIYQRIKDHKAKSMRFKQSPVAANKYVQRRMEFE